MNRIVSAEPLPGCRLKVAFNDGLSGIFAVEPKRRGGVFLKLLDAKVFNAVTVNPDFGCVEWPGGIDLCPDVMHEAMAGYESEKGHPLAAALHEDAKPVNKPSRKPKTGTAKTVTEEHEGNKGGKQRRFLHSLRCLPSKIRSEPLLHAYQRC